MEELNATGAAQKPETAENIENCGICGGQLQFPPEETAKRAEESIRKRFRKKLFSRFAKAVVDYNLISAGDKIAVCMSGGKDSFAMAKLFQELKPDIARLTAKLSRITQSFWIFP